MFNALNLRNEKNKISIYGVSYFFTSFFESNSY
jgi:hypothetical protein